MFTNKKLLTALILSTAFTATTAMADEPTSNLLSQTDYLVASAMADVKQDMTIGITYDVLTASHTFEPDAAEASTLIADITITPMKSDEFQNDNDA
ncbi:hypothetical protein C7Y69_12840 [Alteromonas sp. KS69]|jgi:ABC-type lipoprotein export system ATPase subunit|uniref:hypothetical protein n=1 Tax=Alteromonas sp. KS69 TaxID=2109917 RepID=UPI000F8708A2|nr:hypothetical protein [Alteromonas sp. KS69]RUP79663.1 hypothetical protein C7Y69_12840 [Alteromonas sp. KS69]|tara:strand:+ start:476 stop:763 length:288 start_codon:yes stop_codon:yes gene_type:complete